MVARTSQASYDDEMRIHIAMYQSLRRDFAEFPASDARVESQVLVAQIVITARSARQR